MSTVRQFPQTDTRKNAFLTVTTKQDFVRYYMGRKYYVSRDLTHFVFPHKRELEFSEFREYTFRYTNQYHSPYDGKVTWYGLTGAIRTNENNWR